MLCRCCSTLYPASPLQLHYLLLRAIPWPCYLLLCYAIALLFLLFFAFPLQLLSSLGHRNSKLGKSIANFNSALPFQCYPSHCCAFANRLFAMYFYSQLCHCNSITYHSKLFYSLANRHRAYHIIALLYRCCAYRIILSLAIAASTAPRLSLPQLFKTVHRHFTALLFLTQPSLCSSQRTLPCFATAVRFITVPLRLTSSPFSAIA